MEEMWQIAFELETPQALREDTAANGPRDVTEAQRDTGGKNEKVL